MTLIRREMMTLVIKVLSLASFYIMVTHQAPKSTLHKIWQYHIRTLSESSLRIKGTKTRFQEVKTKSIWTWLHELVH